MSDKEEETEAVGCLAMIFAMPFAFAFKGFVFTWLWHWFIVEQFSLPQIKVAHAAGVCLMMKFLTVPVASTKKLGPKSIVNWFLTPTLVLGIGWLVHYFM